MPGDENKNIEHLEEGASFSGKGKVVVSEKPLTEKNIDELKEKLSDKESDNSLLNMLKHSDASASLFKFQPGIKVRNRHNEDGYVEMCAIDQRGTLYLVNLPKCDSQWYTEHEIFVIPFQAEEKAKVADPRIKTDVQDPDDPARIDRSQQKTDDPPPE